MSCVGDKHPWFQDLSAQLEKEYGVGVRMEAVASQSLSYADLSWLLRIGGVEVLLIDAEGHDCRILQSMIDHCAVYPGAWPDVVQFETMGLNDMQGSYNTEEHMLDLLNKHGYVLACKGVCGRRRRSRRRTAPPRRRTRRAALNHLGAPPPSPDAVSDDSPPVSSDASRKPASEEASSGSSGASEDGSAAPAASPQAASASPAAPAADADDSEEKDKVEALEEHIAKHDYPKHCLTQVSLNPGHGGGARRALGGDPEKKEAASAEAL